MPTDYEKLAEGYLIDTRSLPVKYYKVKRKDLKYTSFNMEPPNNWKKMHHLKKTRRIGRKFRRAIYGE